MDSDTPLQVPRDDEAPDLSSVLDPDLIAVHCGWGLTAKHTNVRLDRRRVVITTQYTCRICKADVTITSRLTEEASRGRRLA